MDLMVRSAAADPSAVRLRAARETGLKVFGIRVLNYVTNHVVNRLPSYRLRHGWYRSVLGVKIGEGSAIFLGCYLWFYGPNQMRRNGLAIGKNCRINRECCLDARDSLWIGDNVSISPYVIILTGQHLADDPHFSLVSKPVRIEDQVWIGTRAMIMPGVTVGRGAVVAAGAVVTRDVEPLTVVAGVPARTIRRRKLDPHYTLSVPLPLFE